MKERKEKKYVFHCVHKTGSGGVGGGARLKSSINMSSALTSAGKTMRGENVWRAEAVEEGWRGWGGWGGINDGKQTPLPVFLFCIVSFPT